MGKANDKLRNEHIAEIERLKKKDYILRKEWKRDIELERYIRLLEKQLIAYDHIMKYE